jgi:hypothetical protein
MELLVRAMPYDELYHIGRMSKEAWGRMLIA